MSPSWKNMSNDELSKYVYLNADRTELEQELAKRLEDVTDEVYELRKSVYEDD